MATILEVQTRLVELCPLIVLPAPLLATKAVRKESECSFADDALPVFVIKRGPGRHTYPDTSSRLSVREFLLKLYVEKVCNPTAADDNEDESALAASCVEPVLDFFTPRPGLSVEIDGEGIVAEARIAQDSGDIPRRFTRNSNAFSGVLFRMQVITRHTAEGANLW